MSTSNDYEVRHGRDNPYAPPRAHTPSATEQGSAGSAWLVTVYHAVNIVYAVLAVLLTLLVATNWRFRFLDPIVIAVMSYLLLPIAYYGGVGWAPARHRRKLVIAYGVLLIPYLAFFVFGMATDGAVPMPMLVMLVANLIALTTGLWRMRRAQGS